MDFDYCSEIVIILSENLNCTTACSPDFNAETIDRLIGYCNVFGQMIIDTETADNYSKPMVWIGIYIAAASLFCTLAMVADLIHGFRNKNFWFPCKYFTLNAASITVITVAMKLPVDLNNPMPGEVDIAAKNGSIAFMCCMMANLMPSLASMSNKELFANVVGLVILVITMTLNVLIQITTGLLDQGFPYTLMTYMGVGTMLSLLIIFTSSAITIPTSKLILQTKYQAAHKRASRNEPQQHSRASTVEELIQHVKRYWVMAGTCNPQFVMASTPLCSAAGIICVPCLVVPVLAMAYLKLFGFRECRSDYRWSTLLILIIQSVGIVVGTIAPIFRCFSTLSFKLSIKWGRNHVKVFKVEKYWTQKLSEWKQSHLGFPLRGRISKTLVHNSKNFILSLCIGFQKVVVVLCKIMGLFPIFVVIFVVYCLYCWKSLKKLFSKTSASSRESIHELEEQDSSEDISNYVLQIHDELEIAKRTLRSMSNSVNRLIQKAEKRPPKNLTKLLEKSTGFEGVGNFDSDHDQVQPLLSVELLNSWSLPVVNLTCIAIALPNINKNTVDCLFRSVGEGLSYTHLVEETLNHAREYVNIQQETMTLWYEVEDKCTWLENTLQRNDFNGKTSKEIIKWFADKAQEIVLEINTNSIEEPTENVPHKLIIANSMYRITQTIMLKYQNNIEQINDDQMFALLSSMIADIVAACLTNLPRVIAQKCHESVIEKREASVEAAAMLLGKTKEIINKLQVRAPTT